MFGTLPIALGTGADVEKIKAAKAGSLTVADSISETVAKIGENMTLRRAAERLQGRVAYPLLVQGTGSRSALLAQFRALGNAVLLGTASFWEGVDVPGRALRGLVLARIPFRVPTEPMTAAQCEAIEADGGSAFDEIGRAHV